LSTPKMVRAEFHMHTHYSSDCSLSFESIVTVARKRGLDALAITDHNRYEGALALQRNAPLAIVPSEEIRALEGELIGYYLKEEIPRGLSASETAGRIREQGGLVCVPHPFDRLRRSRLRLDALLELAERGLIDIIEVENARVIFPVDNQKARRFAEERGLLMSGGSDAHSAPEIGRIHLELPAFDDASSLREALRAARIIGRPSHPLVHVVTIWEKWRKRRRKMR